MLAPLELEPIALQARAVHRIDNARGLQVTCVKGVVWVTQERDSRDIILSAGQSVVLDRSRPCRRLRLQGRPHHGRRSRAAARRRAALPARTRSYAERAWA